VLLQFKNDGWQVLAFDVNPRGRIKRSKHYSEAPGCAQGRDRIEREDGLYSSLFCGEARQGT